MSWTTRRLSLLACVMFAGAALPFACSDDAEMVATAAGPGPGTGATGAQGGASSGGGGTSSGGGSSVGGATVGPGPGSGGSGGFEIAECQGHLYACGDTLDNDMDGLTDSDDPDCLGPCDDTEDSFCGGISGQNNSPCKADCYFDQDTGSGNDDCYWSHKCDPHEMAPDWYPESEVGSQCAYDANANIPGSNQSCAELEQTQSQTCLDYCGPLTPNGCDCFGCCEIPPGSGNTVYLGSVSGNANDCDSLAAACTLADANDPTKCHPCLQVTACLNDCAPCELCIGKTMLPPECFDPDGGGGQECPPESQQCGLPNDPPCPPGEYCITGCCQPVPQ
jgi:hypothetical protein